MLGSQTVKIVTIGSGTTRNRLNQPTPTRTLTTVSGVLMRPVSATEETTLTEISNEIWRCTCPPDTVVSSSGEVLYDGTVNPADTPANRFRVTAVQPFVDFAGDITHIRVTCEKEKS